MALRIYNTLSQKKEPFRPIADGKVGMYVCGVTVYDVCHIGHARAYVAFDVVHRYLEHLGYDVTYVRNFTDVDDKIIKRANERGLEPVELATGHIQSFYTDMDALGVARPQHEPRVSTSIPEIIELVARLVERGLAYEAGGDVYYAVDAFEGYGKLSGRSLDDMVAGARVEVNVQKRNPMDFALWKAAKPGEPKWSSPWGEGRPGWHIECSAMSMSALGPTVDLHAGGQDLIFPHHENEIAQSEGATGLTFVNYWMHNGFVNIDNEKMSKSLGNCFNVNDLFQRYEPQVVRLFMLTTHYRSPINFSDRGLDEAAARMAYFYETLRKTDLLLARDLAPPKGPLPARALVDGFEPSFRAAMDDDFNIAKGIGLLAEVFKQLNELVTVRKKRALPQAAAVAEALIALVKRVDYVLNLFGEDPDAYLDRHRRKAAFRQGIALDWIGSRVGDREEARRNKDWGQADIIRDELLERGVVIMDGPSGTEWAVEDVTTPRDDDGDPQL